MRVPAHRYKQHYTPHDPDSWKSRRCQLSGKCEYAHDIGMLDHHCATTCMIKGTEQDTDTRAPGAITIKDLINATCDVVHSFSAGPVIGYVIYTSSGHYRTYVDRIKHAADGSMHDSCDDIEWIRVAWNAKLGGWLEC